MKEKNRCTSLPSAWASSLLAGFIAISVDSAAAEAPGADPRGTLSVVVENDTFAGTDRNYTNGLELSYFSSRDGAPTPIRWVARHAMGADDQDAIAAGISLGHNIYTPRDTQSTAPLPDQHPYAGWLHLSFLSAVDSGRTLDTLELGLGVVGPAAGGEWVQNKFHDLIGADEAKGWDNQIRNEPAFLITYDRKWRAIAEWRASGFGVDVIPNIGVSVGNVLTQAMAGVTLRFGQDLANDYGPPRVRPSLAGAGFSPRDHFSWYFFVGANGRAVAYNIALDGNAFRDGGPSVDRKPLVAEGQVGLVLQAGRVQTALTVVGRTDEFDGQGKQELFGAISLSMKL